MPLNNTMKLKYLFVAEFSDGSKITQTQDDKSIVEPETRSQFYDVLQSGKRIKEFSLHQIGLWGSNTISVNLQTGLFKINGLDVLLESEKLPTLPDKFELIFYRQHTHNVDATYKVKTGKEVSYGNEQHSCEYFIGWQCNIKGKNYQQKIAVS